MSTWTITKSCNPKYIIYSVRRKNVIKVWNWVWYQVEFYTHYLWAESNLLPDSLLSPFQSVTPYQPPHLLSRFCTGFSVDCPLSHLLSIFDMKMVSDLKSYTPPPSHLDTPYMRKESYVWFPTSCWCVHSFHTGPFHCSSQIGLLLVLARVRRTRLLLLLVLVCVLMKLVYTYTLCLIILPQNGLRHSRSTCIVRVRPLWYCSAFDMQKKD